MKFSLSFIAVLPLFLCTSDAFLNADLTRIKSSQPTLTGLRSVDSDAVQDALVASQKFGPASKEARVAWDIVEEIRARDNR
jgi:CP12 domain.